MKERRATILQYGCWAYEIHSTAHAADGCRTETSVTESSDYPTVTNSVTRYDFLGRVACVQTPAFGGGWLAVSNFYDGASSRLLRVTRTGQPGTLYAYDELGNLAATALDVDPVITTTLFSLMKRCSACTASFGFAPESA